MKDKTTQLTASQLLADRVLAARAKSTGLAVAHEEARAEHQRLYTNLMNDPSFGILMKEAQERRGTKSEDQVGPPWRKGTPTHGHGPQSYRKR